MLHLSESLVLLSLKLLFVVEIVVILRVTLLHHVLSKYLGSGIARAVYPAVIKLLYLVPLLAL